MVRRFVDRNTETDSNQSQFMPMGSRALVGTRRTLRGTFYDKGHRHRAIEVDQPSRSETDWHWRTRWIATLQTASSTSTMRSLTS